MSIDAKHEAAIPNPVLKPLSVLVGKWDMVGTHRAIPNTTLHGHASFEWIEGGAFLVMHSAFEEPGIPTSVAIFGSDDSTEEYSMLYFDERGVSRKYAASLRENVWKLWRDAPGYLQRFTGTFSEQRNVIHGVWLLSVTLRVHQ